MEKVKRHSFLENAETIFQILFLIYTALGFNSITFGTPIISVFMWISYLLGAGLLLVRLWNWKQYIKMPGLVLLLLMCTVCGISILVNHQYDFKKNVIYLIFWAFYFLMFYAQNSQVSPELVKKRFRILGHIMCVCAFVLVVISLWMMYVRYSEVTQVNGSEVIRGFTYGRLFGAYLTPNGGAVVGSIIIFLSIYFIGIYRSLLYRIWAGLNILVQLLYITFSDSRSGTLSLAFGSAVYVCFAVLGSSRIQKKSAKGIVAGMLTVATLVGAMYFPSAVQDMYNSAMISISEKIAQSSTKAPDENQMTQPEESPETAPTEDAAPALKPEEFIDSYVIDRGYDLSGDISNRRFDIWKSGLEIFARNPWLGTTFTGFLPYAQEHMPETYIVSNDYLQMTTLDSDFVNLLVSCGIVAFLAFIAFVLLVLAYLFRNYAKMKEKDPQIPVMMAVCMAAATFSVFTSGVLYMQSPFSAIFWLSLGGLIVIVSADRKEKKK